MRGNVAVAIAPAVDAAYPAAWGAEVRVETRDGRRFSAMRRAAKGDPENPVDEAELTAKAIAHLIEGGMRAREADALIETVLALPADRPVRDLGIFPQDGAGLANGRA